MSKRGAVVLLFFVFIAYVFFFASISHAQGRNTFQVENFDGATLGAKLTAAQAACFPSTSVPCVISIGPTMAAAVFPQGTLPSRCAQCVWMDYRSTNGPQYGTATGLLNGERFVDGAMFTSVAEASADCGNSVPCIVVIPSTYAGTECPAVSDHIIYIDYRAGAKVSGGVSSFICSQNAINYNTNTAGFTDAMVRQEMTRTGVNAAGSIVSQYIIAHLTDATVTGGTVDGDAPEAQTNGTLTGSLGYLIGSEQTASAMSTGGAVDTAAGALGVVFSTAGSTTAITNAYGLWGRGCKSSISGSAPTNCFGVFADRQLGAATSRNYALGMSGFGLVLYDSNIGGAGLDIEDTSHSIHRLLYMDSLNHTRLRAVGVAGLELQSSDEVTQATVSESGFQVATVLNTPKIAGVTDTGTVTNLNADTVDGKHASDFLLVGGNAVTASALAANPTDCTAAAPAISIAANGNLGCTPNAVTALGSTGTLSMDFSLGSIFTTTPSGSITLNATNCATGLRATIIVTTSGSSSFTVTPNTNMKGTPLATGTTTAKTFGWDFVCNGTTAYQAGVSAAY